MSLERVCVCEKDGFVVVDITGNLGTEKIVELER